MNFSVLLHIESISPESKNCVKYCAIFAFWTLPVFRWRTNGFMQVRRRSTRNLKDEKSCC